MSAPERSLLRYRTGCGWSFGYSASGVSGASGNNSVATLQGLPAHSTLPAPLILSLCLLEGPILRPFATIRRRRQQVFACVGKPLADGAREVHRAQRSPDWSQAGLRRRRSPRQAARRLWLAAKTAGRNERCHAVQEVLSRLDAALEEPYGASGAVEEEEAGRVDARCQAVRRVERRVRTACELAILADPDILDPREAATSRHPAPGASVLATLLLHRKLCHGLVDGVSGRSSPTSHSIDKAARHTADGGAQELPRAPPQVLGALSPSICGLLGLLAGQARRQRSQPCRCHLRRGEALLTRRRPAGPGPV
mmetsp:Transcript_121049/g.258467  ORF Transcript_121049/g.258467 Transcript_121049/m.258467 type:complete len:310 (-) Transcript_121049:191-1120(-)